MSKPTSEMARNQPSELRKTGLDLPNGLSFAAWKSLGAKLGCLSGCIQWAIGDWLNYGERVYGEKYREAEEVLGRSYQGLADLA